MVCSSVLGSFVKKYNVCFTLLFKMFWSLSTHSDLFSLCTCIFSWMSHAIPSSWDLSSHLFSIIFPIKVRGKQHLFLFFLFVSTQRVNRRGNGAKTRTGSIKKQVQFKIEKIWKIIRWTVVFFTSSGEIQCGTSTKFSLSDNLKQRGFYDFSTISEEKFLIHHLYTVICIGSTKENQLLIDSLGRLEVFPISTWRCSGKTDQQGSVENFYRALSKNCM